MKNVNKNNEKKNNVTGNQKEVKEMMTGDPLRDPSLQIFHFCFNQPYFFSPDTVIVVETEIEMTTEVVTEEDADMVTMMKNPDL